MFSYTQDYEGLLYIISFWCKLGIYSQISFFQKNFFFIFFQKKFFFENFQFAMKINYFWKHLSWNFDLSCVSKIINYHFKPKIFKKNFEIFLKKTGKNFFLKKNLICVNVSQKMMIYHKMSMSGVYENVFQTSENYS